MRDDGKQCTKGAAGPDDEDRANTKAGEARGGCQDPASLYFGHSECKRVQELALLAGYQQG
jgi:hypothetical protein